MRFNHFLCVGLALVLSSCASWHRPGLAYRGKGNQQIVAQTDIPERTRAIPVDLVDDEERLNDPQTFDLGQPTLTPPIESVTRRTGYRAQPERARPVRKERVPVLPPGPGYVELPEPPE